MRNVSYRTTSKLACDCNSTVVLCVSAALTLDDSGFINGTVNYSTKSATVFGSNCAPSCGCGTSVSEVYNYYISYDETLLADQNYSLISTDINGVLCGDCLLAYIQYLSGHTQPSGSVLSRAIINVPANSTDYNIISEDGSKIITVYQMVILEGDTATTVTFNTKGVGVAGTPISPPFSNDALGGFVLPYSPEGWMETLAGEALTITTGDGSDTVGLIGFRQL